MLGVAASSKRRADSRGNVGKTKVYKAFHFILYVEVTVLHARRTLLKHALRSFPVVLVQKYTNRKCDNFRIL